MESLGRTFALAMRNVRRQFGRSLFVISAVAFGVIALILAGGFIRDTIIELGDSIIYAQTGHLQISATGYREEASFDPEAFMIEDAGVLQEELNSRPAVKQVLLRLYTDGLAGNGDSDWPVLIEGVQPERETALGSYINIASGRRLSPDDPFGALLGAGVAQALGIAPGDWINVVTTTLNGAMNALEFEVVGTFQTFSKDYDAHALRIPLEAARELLDAVGANVIVIELRDTAATAAEMAALETELGSRGLSVERWEDLDPFYYQTVELYQQQFGFLIAVILVLVVLGVATALGTGIFERAGEFGTLRAVGTRDSSVVRLILSEALLLGIVGAVAGVVAGNLLALAISAVGIPMPPPPNSDLGYVSLIRLSVPVSMLAALVGVTAPVLAAVRPSRAMRRMLIADALRKSV